MGLNSFLAVVFLVCLCQMQGSSAVTPVFVQKGKDVLLNVTTADVLEDFTFVSWNFNKNVVFVRFLPGREPIVSDGYTGRIEFSEKNFSVKLKNLQKADSGVYTARVIGTEEQTTEYNVTVQDPVSPAGLTVDSVSSSSDSCNLTVTCSAQDSHISSTFTCDHQTCSQEGGARSEVTTSGASLHVYLVNDSIICNHSNYVSWEQDKKEIKSFCEPPPVPNRAIPIVIGTSVAGLVICLCIFLFVKYKKKNYGNTVYAVPQDINPAQTLNTNPTEDVSGLSPTSTYCLVQFHTGSAESTRTKNTSMPETVYAQVDRTAKTNCRPPPQPTPRAGEH